MAADSDLTTPATVALELGVSAADPRLPRLISVASDAIAAFLNRQLHYIAGMTELVQGFGRPRLLLNVSPIVSITSITLPDGTVVTDYIRENDKAGILYRRSGWASTALARGGLPPQNDVAPGTQEPAISVVYSAGWVTPAAVAGVRSLPYDIEEACVQTVVTRYRRGGQDEAISQEALGDYSVTYRDQMGIASRGSAESTGMLPDSVVAQLAKYSRPLG